MMRRITLAILLFTILLVTGSMGHFIASPQGVVTTVNNHIDTSGYIDERIELQKQKALDSLKALKELEPPIDPNAPRRYVTTTYINGRLTNTVRFYKNQRLVSTQYELVRK